MHEKALRVTMSEIAELTGQPVQRVWRHQRDGELDMGNLERFVKYVMARMLMREARDARKAKKGSDVQDAS